MVNNREADSSMNGYYYQRLCALYFFFRYMYIKYIKEEGIEDVDLYFDDSSKIVIQVKYISDSESLTEEGGLFKVIKENYLKTDIKEIIYYVYSTNNTFYNENLLSVFNNNEYYKIGKYFLIICYNKNQTIKENKIKINIKSINKIDTIFDLHKDKIKDNVDNNIYDFFSNELSCINYFSKFKLENGLSYDELNLLIDNTIETKYNEFIISNNEEQKILKQQIIKNCVLNYLTKTMFNKQERQIDCNDIYNEINNKIEIFSNSQNLLFELCKNMAQEINSNSNLINIIINDFSNLNIISNEVICLYISILNRKYLRTKLNQTQFENIKNIILSFIWSKLRTIEDKNIADKCFRKYNQIKNYKIIKNFRSISSITLNSFKMNHYQLFQLICTD